MNKSIKIKKKKDIKGIQRLDVKKTGTYGWYCRVSVSGKTVEMKFFADNKFGSSEEALVQAKSWLIARKIHYRKLYPISCFKRRPMAPRSNTGITGVTHIKSGDDDRFQASWYDKNGKKVQKSFSVRKYGEGEAFSMAWSARLAAEKLKYGK